MKKISSALFISMLIFNCSLAEAKTGDLINIQFGLSDMTPVYDGPAKCGSYGQLWNLYDANDDVPPVSLKLSNGSSSSAFVTVNFDTIGVINTGRDVFAGTNDDKMMRYYALTGSTATVDFTHLNRFAIYDLYLYSQEAKNTKFPTTTFTVNGMDYTITNTVNTAEFVYGSNYITITGIQTDASGNLSFAYGPGVNASIGALNGIQLIENSSPEPVPEPSTIALIGVGFVFALAVKKSKRNDENA
jgi:hypothetical protein